MLKKFFLMFITLSLCLCFCSCSFREYGEKDVKRYVSAVYGKDWKLTENDSPRYIFTNNKGNSFTVTVTTYHPFAMDGAAGPGMGYRIDDDYFEAIWDDNHEEISEITERYDFDILPKFYNECVFLLINSEDDAKNAAKAVSEIDRILSYKCNYGMACLARVKLTNYKERKVRLILCYKSEDVNADNEICCFNLSRSRFSRLSEKKCLRKINRHIKVNG